MSALFHEYFMCNFHLGCFRDENPALIQTAYIKQYIKNIDTNAAVSTILKIFSKMKYAKHPIEIDPDFPKERLVSIMLPYLKMYYYSAFSFDVMIKQANTIRLKSALREFYRFNPMFGRKMIDLKNRKIKFNDTHKPYKFSSTLMDFKTSHLAEPDVLDELLENGSVEHVVSNPVVMPSSNGIRVEVVAVEREPSEDGDGNSDSGSDISDLDDERNEEMYDP